eukprot:TRINITY_DN29047_c0_g1_i1.p1 TRINITY_DN29047_c0_g1~~TRINITY_DN29047_c0_g1_i1.p1  ORF type:complete len:270 (+),score=64.82 TRINITY_DN29047_c0_g1_i1:158-967(+)
MSSPIRKEKNGPVTTVILHRPEARNAVDKAVGEALEKAFRDFETDDSARVAVLWGDGGTFCAGFDLKAVAADPERANVLFPVGDGRGPMGPSRMVLSKPVIAAVSGFAVAGGLELAAWCDLRVVEEDAVMGVFCRRWGVPLIDGGTVRLPRLIGLSRALDLILTGRPVSAKEALEMGLANRVVLKGQARAEAEKLAQSIAEFPQVCMRMDRQSAYEQHDRPLFDALKNEFELGSRAFDAQETVEGATRFLKGAGRHGTFADGGRPKAKL